MATFRIVDTIDGLFININLLSIGPLMPLSAEIWSTHVQTSADDFRLVQKI